MTARYRAIYKNGKLFAEYEGEHLVWLDPEYQPPKASDLAAPSLIRDTIEPFQSMADGQLYDSKSAYRRSLGDRGLVELGNDAPLAPPPPPPPKSTRRELLHRQLADVSDREADKALKQLKKELTP
jgi:hypothetical protein